MNFPVICLLLGVLCLFSGCQYHQSHGHQGHYLQHNYMQPAVPYDEPVPDFNNRNIPPAPATEMN